MRGEAGRAARQGLSVNTEEPYAKSPRETRDVRGCRNCCTRLREFSMGEREALDARRALRTIQSIPGSCSESNEVWNDALWPEE